MRTQIHIDSRRAWIQLRLKTVQRATVGLNSEISRTVIEELWEQEWFRTRIPVEQLKLFIGLQSKKELTDAESEFGDGRLSEEELAEIQSQGHATLAQVFDYPPREFPRLNEPAPLASWNEREVLLAAATVLGNQVRELIGQAHFPVQKMLDFVAEQLEDAGTVEDLVARKESWLHAKLLLLAQKIKRVPDNPSNDPFPPPPNPAYENMLDVIDEEAGAKTIFADWKAANHNGTVWFRMRETQIGIITEYDKFKAAVDEARKKISASATLRTFAPPVLLPPAAGLALKNPIPYTTELSLPAGLVGAALQSIADLKAKETDKKLLADKAINVRDAQLLLTQIDAKRAEFEEAKKALFIVDQALREDQVRYDKEVAANMRIIQMRELRDGRQYAVKMAGIKNWFRYREALALQELAECESRYLQKRPFEIDEPPPPIVYVQTFAKRSDKTVEEERENVPKRSKLTTAPFEIAPNQPLSLTSVPTPDPRSKRVKWDTVQTPTQQAPWVIEPVGPEKNILPKPPPPKILDKELVTLRDTKVMNGSDTVEEVSWLNDIRELAERYEVFNSEAIGGRLWVKSTLGGDYILLDPYGPTPDFKVSVIFFNNLNVKIRGYYQYRDEKAVNRVIAAYTQFIEKTKLNKGEALIFQASNARFVFFVGMSKPGTVVEATGESPPGIVGESTGESTPGTVGESPPDTYTYWSEKLKTPYFTEYYNKDIPAKARLIQANLYNVLDAIVLNMDRDTLKEKFAKTSGFTNPAFITKKFPTAGFRGAKLFAQLVKKHESTRGPGEWVAQVLEADSPERALMVLKNL